MVRVSDSAKYLDDARIFVSREETGSETDAFDPDGKTDRYQEMFRSKPGSGFSNRSVADRSPEAAH